MKKLFFCGSFFFHLSLGYSHVSCDLVNLEINSVLNIDPGNYSQRVADSALPRANFISTGSFDIVDLDRARASASRIGIDSKEGFQNLILLSEKVLGSEVELVDRVEILAHRLRGAKGKVGIEFEEHLVDAFGGRGSFKVSGREFDGEVSGVWYEAKSGNYWSHDYGRKGFQKFKSDMGARLKITGDNSKEYHLISNTPITKEAKEWMIQKGIKFIELLE